MLSPMQATRNAFVAGIEVAVGTVTGVCVGTGVGVDPGIDVGTDVGVDTGVGVGVEVPPPQPDNNAGRVTMAAHSPSALKMGGRGRIFIKSKVAHCGS